MRPVRSTFRRALLGAALSLCIAAPALAADGTTTSAPPKADFLASHMDTSVDPGVDFFEYANGAWLKAPSPR